MSDQLVWEIIKVRHYHI